MTREIKFRAWNKVDKCFLENDYGRLDCRTQQHLNFNGEIIYKIIARNNIVLDQSNWIELSQFTGLKDKNGKEIYEGDIIDGICTHKYIVRFGEQEIKDNELYGSNTVIGFHLEKVNNELCDWEKYGHMDSMSDAIVIGNIYENPELLGARK
jgi:uncharacterized phage protein (TIGR01671 family)